MTDLSHLSPPVFHKKVALSNTLWRFWLSLSCLLLSSACGGAHQLKGQLGEAQREREVLRDAYEAQQLRLRELESRLLRLEDRGTQRDRLESNDLNRSKRSSRSNVGGLQGPSTPDA